jgi:AraC-like DNA-binding protein
MNLPTTPAKMNLSSSALRVELSIASEQLTDVLSLLMNQNISFTINYAPKLIPEVVAEKQPISSIVEEPFFLSRPKGKPINVKYTEIVRAVYKYYFIDNIEKMPPNITEIAGKYDITPITLKNVFKTVYEKPFYQLYMEKRMEYAAKLLKNGYGANKVSERLGYSQAIKFNKIFQKYYGITPKKYQMQF